MNSPSAVITRVVLTCALLVPAVGAAPAVAKRPEIPGATNKGPKVKTPVPVIEVPTVTPVPTALPTPTPSTAPPVSSGGSGGGGSGSGSGSGSGGSGGGKGGTTSPVRTPTPTRTPEPAKAPAPVKTPNPAPRKPVVTPGLPGAVATPVAALPVVSDVSGTPTVSGPTPVGDAPTFARTPDGTIVVVRRAPGGRGRVVTPVSSPAGPTTGGSSSGDGGSSAGVATQPRVLSTFGPGADPVTEAIGGVFGAIPAALLGAVPTGEVAGALQRSGSSRSSSPSFTEVSTANEPRESLASPLAAIERVTGGRVNPLLVIAALAAMAGALALGIRRELHRW